MGREAYIHPRLVALAGAAGCVDAASFLGLQEVFTANQTGNTVLLGIALGQGDWDAVARSGVAVAAFCAGVVAAAIVLRGAAPGWNGRVNLVLAVEALLLGVLAALWGPLGTIALIALVAAAMGAQSAAAQHVGVPGVSTTFVTGTLTRIATRLVVRGDGPREAAPAVAWAAYLGGAVAGGWLSRGWSDAAGVAAAALLVALSVLPWPAAARRSRLRR